MSLVIYEDFRSRSRHAEKITGGIWVIFRGLFFPHNAEIGRKDHNSMTSGNTGGTYYKPLQRSKKNIIPVERAVIEFLFFKTNDS